MCEGEQLPQSDIKSAGLKITLPRLKVLEVLEAADPHHLSAEDVYRKLIETDESVGLATVYRTLHHLHKAELIEEHSFTKERIVYELKQPNKHHDHLFCLRCSQVVQEFTDKKIEKLQKTIAKDNNFQLINHHTTLFGYCTNCQK